MEKKMVSTSQNISPPLARISYFFENCFPLIPIMVSASIKIVRFFYLLFNVDDLHNF